MSPQGLAIFMGRIPMPNLEIGLGATASSELREKY